MAIEIDTKQVTQVLLLDGQWHEVLAGSFDVGDAWPWQEGGQTTGAQWIEAGSDAERTVFCPLSTICAVAYDWDSSPKD